MGNNRILIAIISLLSFLPLFAAGEKIYILTNQRMEDSVDTVVTEFTIDTVQPMGRNLRNMLSGFSELVAGIDFKLFRLDYYDGAFLLNQLLPMEDQVGLRKEALYGAIDFGSNGRKVFAYIHGDSVGALQSLLVPTGNEIEIVKTNTPPDFGGARKYWPAFIEGYMDHEGGWLIPVLIEAEGRHLNHKRADSLDGESWRILWRQWDMDFPSDPYARYTQIISRIPVGWKHILGDRYGK